MIARLVGSRIAVYSLVVGLLLPGVALAQDKPAGGGDKPAGGGGGGDAAGGGAEETATAAPQPEATTGGRYSLANYAKSEVIRTLTIIQGVLEAKPQFDLDLSKDVEAKTGSLGIAVRYGISDSTELQAAFSSILFQPDGSPDAIQKLGVGIETAIKYDLVDVRLAVEIPVLRGISENGVDILLGAPFKIRAMENKLAIVGAERVLVFHTNAANDGFKVGATIPLRIIYQILDNLAAQLQGSLNFPTLSNFDAVASIQIPLSLGIQYTFNNRFDIGLDFQLEYIKGIDFGNNRGADLYVRARF